MLGTTNIKKQICDVATEGTPPTHCGPFFVAIKITTLCSRFPLHKIIIAQLAKKLLAFYRNRRSFSACTRIPVLTQMNPVHNFHSLSFSLIFPKWEDFPSGLFTLIIVQKDETIYTLFIAANCSFAAINKLVYTGCNRRNGPDFGRVFLRSNYTDIIQNTYIPSSMVTEILAREV